MPVTRKPSTGPSICESCASGEKSSPTRPDLRSSAPCAAVATCSPQPARHRHWTEAKLPHRTKHRPVAYSFCFVVRLPTKYFTPATKPLFPPDVTSKQQPSAREVG